jgi:hypothetical protein
VGWSTTGTGDGHSKEEVNEDRGLIKISAWRCRPLNTTLGYAAYTRMKEKPSLFGPVPTTGGKVEGGLRHFLASDHHIRAKQKDELPQQTVKEWYPITSRV